jgi:glycosyltransferase involved in cell wall biosynthesis
MSPGPLAILYVGVLPPALGGAQHVGGLLVTGLAERGHRVRAISPITAEAQQDGDVLARAHPALRVARLVAPPTPVDDARAEDAYRRELGARLRQAVIDEIASDRPAVLVTSNTSMAVHVPELQTAHDVPCVLIVHGSTALGMIARTVPPDHDLLVGLRQTARLVAVAPHLARALGRLGLDDICVIENPVDVGRFAPRPKDPDLMEALAVTPEDLVVAHLSRLASVKRPLDVVLSAERALRSNPRLLYLVLGDGPLRATMEEACAQRGLTPRFRFVGGVAHAAVPAYLNLADVVVMPSESEGQCLVYLETQACGRVLLASDIPAAREVIIDGETGLLFRRGDIGHLAARTLDAAADPGLRASIGVRARQAAETHALDTVVASYEALFREVIARRGTG